MAYTAAQIIEFRCPTLYADSNLTKWINLATDQLSSAFFGDDFSLAVSLLACHMYMLSPTNRPMSESGSINSKKEGDLSINFSNNSNIKGTLSQTAFGIELATLMEENRATITVVGDSATIT